MYQQSVLGTDDEVPLILEFLKHYSQNINEVTHIAAMMLRSHDTLHVTTLPRTCRFPRSPRDISVQGDGAPKMYMGSTFSHVCFYDLLSS